MRRQVFRLNLLDAGNPNNGDAAAAYNVGADDGGVLYSNANNDAITGSTAVGSNAAATGSLSTAYGSQARATGGSTVALGGCCRYRWNSGAIATGLQSAATGQFSQASGVVSSATGDASTAIGHSSLAEGYGPYCYWCYRYS